MDPDNNNSNNTDISKEIYTRSFTLFIIFMAVGLLIILSILNIQFGSDGNFLRGEVKNANKFKFITMHAKRGDILDHKERLLSTSVPQYHLHMDFKSDGLPSDVFHENVNALGNSLSIFFKDKSPKAYTDSLKRWYKAGYRYKRVSPRRINYLELREVLKFPIYNRGRYKGGFALDTLNVRFRPNGSLARRTLGLKNKTGSNYGLESFFDNELKGVDGITASQKISGNFWMPVQNDANQNPIDGYDIISTLDIEVQRVAEDALRIQLSENEAIWGSAVLMEVETGEIRAIANLTQSKSDPTQYIDNYNHAIAKNMEPGSTFKLATLMALIDDAKVPITTTYDTEGGVARVHGSTIRDTRDYGTISLKRCFEVSSNVCFTKAINNHYRSNPNKFVDYLERIKLMEPFNLQIKGEQTPIIRRPKDKYWNGTTLTMMSYGYALMLTPLKTLTLYNAIANNGQMVAPSLVKEIRKGEQVIKSYPKRVMVESITSKKTLREIRSSLEGVVNEGTARLVLLNDNYKVAGKTGTAQVARGRQGYSIVNGGRNYLATIVGYFPADKPKYSCIVTIETFYTMGSNKKYYGSNLAGPVFRAIADKVFSLTPEWVGSIEKPVRNKIASAPKQVKDIQPKYAIKKGLPIHTNAVSKRFNRYNNNTLNKKDIERESSGVKDVIGMPFRDAIYTLEQQQLHISFSGRGTVIEQSLVVGSDFLAGDTINLILK